MTARGPQHRVRVEVHDGEGRRIAGATCFFSTFEDDVGRLLWRGFLADLDPAGTLVAGGYALALDDGRRVAVEVTEVRTEPREQAIFRGRGDPPPVDA